MIFLGADHAGYSLKETIKQWLIERGETINDLGADSDANVDYPEYAEKVAHAVIEHRGKGILFCRSGQGMAIAANKIPGVRAAIVWNTDIAKETRQDNDSNVIVLPSGFVSEPEAKEIIQFWLNTPFSSAERHLRRIKQIHELEN